MLGAGVVFMTMVMAVPTAQVETSGLTGLTENEDSLPSEHDRRHRSA